MQPQTLSQTSSDASASPPRDTSVPDYPVRDYIHAMSQELAQMARWDGDEALAVLLEAAMARAALKVAPSR